MTKKKGIVNNEEFVDTYDDKNTTITNPRANYYKTTTGSITVLAIVCCLMCSIFLYILSGSMNPGGMGMRMGFGSKNNSMGMPSY
jgi:hypothetical protein